MCLLLFLLYGYHPELHVLSHSFPTRRSSDLVDAAERLSELPGVRLLNHGFFNKFTLVLDSDARLVVRELSERNILGGVTLCRLYPERSEEHTSELQSLLRISYAVFCLN